jgi:beta-galactosidase
MAIELCAARRGQGRPCRAGGLRFTADIQDANGVFVPNANNSITFSVSGPGQLVGADNGDPTDTSSYKGTARKAFSGKALAMVRSTETAGSIVVTASASGLTSAPVTVASQ